MQIRADASSPDSAYSLMGLNLSLSLRLAYVPNSERIGGEVLRGLSEVCGDDAGVEHEEDGVDGHLDVDGAEGVEDCFNDGGEEGEGPTPESTWAVG